MAKAIALVETRTGCEICETQSRYDVLLHGKKVGQLYFNMRGYVGTLPTPRGTHLCIGERTISAYRKAVAQLNKEWAGTQVPPIGPSFNDVSHQPGEMTMQATVAAKFDIGVLLATPGATEALDRNCQTPLEFLRRHI